MLVNGECLTELVIMTSHHHHLLSSALNSTQVSSLVASRRPVVVKEEAHLNIFMKMEISGRIHEADSRR